MELRQLEHFVAVAEEGHFSRAAERVHIVQSGLSSSIRSLERELGAELFIRTTRHVAMTEAGRQFLTDARSALAAAQRARDAVAGVRQLLRGHLTMGIMQVLEPIDLPAVLARFHGEHPGLEIDLRQAGASTLIEQLRAGVLDLAFVALPPDQLQGLDVTVISDEAMRVACPPAHRLATRKKISLADLADECFIGFSPSWAARIVIDRAFAAAGVRPRMAFELNDLRTVLGLVANRLGVAIVPRSVAKYRMPVKLIPLGEGAPRWQLSVVTRAGERPSAATRAFVDMLELDGNAP
ncbi:LysR family transcriptional regulator [Kribbella kalugense]|uniref:DNA-binding transcriptional LysR family regulator n=1 Tax=Kribbella kalugense TaxID=2512221 RepID=A0A4R8A240_9ACTN|nr:LysR family transcriptional regulator [Kribbella kalugense]TDW24275.1 DNA-binding transcriptional LysR family regulator [Kribbella kalugense]